MLARILPILLLLAMLPAPVLAATISGTVYDLDLARVESAIVTITSTPEQRIVAKNGTYVFDIPEGMYVLEAWAHIDGLVWQATENVTVTTDGAYIFDIILTPSFDGIDDIDLEEDELPVISSDARTRGLSGTAVAIGAIAGTAIICAGAYALHRARKHTRAHAKRHSPTDAGLPVDDEYVRAVVDALRQQGGRATQKEIRKAVPFSEAKVSLVLAELESSGKVQKIRKGRGNVIVLK